MINIIGLGYIGLPTALMFAKSGQKIVGTDLNKKLIESLNKGDLPFEEAGLESLFNAAVENGIIFTTDYQEVDCYIIAVPTPYIKDSKKLDPTLVISAVNSVLDVCKKGSIIIIESTLSPGSIDKYVRPEIIKRGKKIGEEVHLAHAPERIIPGNMLYELENNSRTIGCDNHEVGNKIASLYASFCNAPIIITDIRSAEMSKVVENTYRDVNIAFANELAKICSSAGMDVYEIIRIANMHPRVNILQPGPGVGGHCISVDPWFLVGDYPDLAKLILSARLVNDSMPDHVLSKIKKIMLENSIEFSKVGIYGLSYKENIDDVRESPALQLLGKMKQSNIKNAKVYDPMIKTKIVENQFFDFETFLSEIDLLVVIIAHDHIKANLSKLSEKIVLDTKNIYSGERVYKL